MQKTQEIPGSGRSPGVGHGSPFQYSCLNKIPWTEEAGRLVHGVAKSQTRLSDFTFTFHFPTMEKEMATHSSVLAWRIPGTGEPGRLLSMGSHRVGHDWKRLSSSSGSIDRRSRIECLKIKPIHLWPIDFQQCAKAIQWWRLIFLIYDADNCISTFIKWSWIPTYKYKFNMDQWPKYKNYKS